jgi:hypothetical protein
MEELVLMPKKIDSLEGLNVKKLVVGHNHSVAWLSSFLFFLCSHLCFRGGYFDELGV